MLRRPATGRLLVTLAPAARCAARARPPRRVAARRARAPAGFSVPQIRLVTVRPRDGRGAARLPRAPRRPARPRASSVEHRARRASTPNDPALSTPETAPGARRARRSSGGRRAAASRSRGTSRPARARRSRSSTPASTTSHPELAGKIAATPRLRRRRERGDDRQRRARHPRRLAGLRRRRQRHRPGRRRTALPAADPQVRLHATPAWPRRSSTPSTTAPTRST